MVDEKAKTKILKVKREPGESGKSELLKTSLKPTVKVKIGPPDRKDKETLEMKEKGTPERKDKGSLKGKDPVNASKDSGKVTSTEKVKVKDLLKVKDEKEKEKGTSPAVKTALVKTVKVEPVIVSKLGSATKVTPKSIKVCSSVGSSLPQLQGVVACFCAYHSNILVEVTSIRMETFGKNSRVLLLLLPQWDDVLKIWYTL